MLRAGSGNSTCSPSPVAGPPTRCGSRNCQPTEEPYAGTSAATDRGMTIISGDRATVRLVGCTSCAPCGKLRATFTHSEESGIQASNAGLAADLFPDISVAAADDCTLVTCTTAQCPCTALCSALKNLATWLAAGAMSGEAARLTTTG